LIQLVNPLNAKLNPICHLLALFRAHHILHVSRIGVKDRKSWNDLVQKTKTHVGLYCKKKKKKESCIY
jgi:hypothetical protein